MNKKLYIPALASLLMLAGCTADEQDEGNGLVPLSLSAEIQTEEVTRAGTTLLNSFGSVDVLGINLTNCVNSSGTALSTTTYTVGTGFDSQPYISAGQTATVKGYYPSSAASASSFTVSDNQTTDAKYKESDLMFAAAQNATKSSSSPTLTFVHKMAKLIVNVTAVSGVGSITSVTLNNISRTVGWTPGTGALGTLSNSSSITMSNGGAVLIPPQTTLEDNDFLTIGTSAGTATYKLGKTFDGGSVYTLNINVGLANIGVSTTITGWTGNESTLEVKPTVETPLPDRTPAGVVAVDLGLSVKWANMNIGDGISAETDYGFYYAWGETVGRSGTNTSGTASDGYSYDWNNYAWSNGASNKLTKYVPTDKTNYWDASGSPDGKMKLEFCDDAAYVAWGGAWRMPSKAEWEELKNSYNCTWEWKENYNGSGVNGYLVTSKKSGYTSNSIFLPAAGGRFSTYVYGQGEYGVYWSSSLDAGYPLNAWRLYFNSDVAYMSYDIGYYGYSVRAVQ